MLESTGAKLDKAQTWELLVSAIYGRNGRATYNAVSVRLY